MTTLKLSAVFTVKRSFVRQSHRILAVSLDDDNDDDDHGGSPERQQAVVLPAREQ